MPIKRIQDLPEQVKENLPYKGQEIWMAAYNNALDTYSDPKKRDDPKEDAETVAAQVAWAAVKHKYEKDEQTGMWRRKD
jgi:cation transport regulator